MRADDFTSATMNLSLDSIANKAGKGYIRSLHSTRRWSRQQASRYIEQAMLNVGCGSIQLVSGQGAQPKGVAPANHYDIVVDGAARILSIARFFGYDIGSDMECGYKTGFRLKGLRVLTEFEGKSFAELSPAEQASFMNCGVAVVSSRGKGNAEALAGELRSLFYGG